MGGDSLQNSDEGVVCTVGGSQFLFPYASSTLFSAFSVLSAPANIHGTVVSVRLNPDTSLPRLLEMRAWIIHDG